MTNHDIIQAAFQVWGRTLYQNTSLSQLAQALGVTKPALYRHFNNKQSLLEAMYEYFFDDYAASIKPAYDQATRTGDSFKQLLLLTESIVRYYGRNQDAFLFCLLQVYGRKEMNIMTPGLKKRGIDMKGLIPIECHGKHPSALQLIITTAIFWLALFHKYDHAPNTAPSEGELSRIAALIREKITQGLGFALADAAAVDFDRLETRSVETVQTLGEEPGLLKAVAEAVAEAGPWNATMEMVAQRSGLSKSSLYSHFKNKQDMIAQLFVTEFEGIIHYAELNQQKSGYPLEKLYLTIIAIADYLRAKPEILVALDWIKTRKLDLGIQGQLQFHWLLDACMGNYGALDGAMGERDPDDPNSESNRNSRWILFLIVNILMCYPPGMDFVRISDESFRILFRFIVSGIGAFQYNKNSPREFSRDAVPEEEKIAL